MNFGVFLNFFGYSKDTSFLHGPCTFVSLMRCLIVYYAKSPAPNAAGDLLYIVGR